jgi:hypothetical protein
MSKADKRENIIMVDRAVVFSTCRCNDRLSFRSPVSHSRLKEVQFLPGNNLNSSQFFCTADWMEIKTNHMVVITPKMNLLQIPIIDQYYVPPSDPNAFARTTEFAQEKGLLNPRKNIPAVDAVRCQSPAAS